MIFLFLFLLLSTRQEEASPVLLQHPEMCQSSGAAGASVSHHTGQNSVSSNARLLLKPDINCCIFINVLLFQLCVERCPDRHLTLVKAKVGSKEDHEYYRQYCKEGVDFAKLVNKPIIVLLYSSRRPEMVF